MAIPPITPYSLPAADELPANLAPWRLDPQRAVLLIHDMQQYFVDFFPAGEEPMSGLIRNISAVRRAAAAQGMPVVYTAQPGGMSRDERGLLHDFWGPGMDKSVDRRRVVPELAPAQQDVVLTKWRYSAFARTSLDSMLDEWGRDQLVICGIYAHVGILMTACDAFTRDVAPFVVADGVADFTERDHRMALDYAANRCAVTLPTAAVLEALAAVSV